MSKAYVETTVLTNILLKPGSKKHEAARIALSRYESSLLPVYAIKELKAGPLDCYSYVHDKLAITHSLRDTLGAINSLSPRTPGRKSTSYEALEAAAQLEPTVSGVVETPPQTRDEEMADRYRLALASLIVRSWRKRRKVANETIQDLECYTEAEPKIRKDGLFDLNPKYCERDRECCLGPLLKAPPEVLRALRDAIPEGSPREEDRRRRRVLKQLTNTPKIILDRDQCRALGDAIFAFFCPDDAVILTTNIKDHKPLAEAIGKRAESP